MKPKDALSLVGVPADLHAQAIASLALAKERNRGLTWHKLKVRLFRAGKIAKLLKWGDERLLDVRPDLADWDIEPMTNITCNGDHVPWVFTQDGRFPAPGRWLNPDPASAEYQEAVNDPISQRYFGGAHPRSPEARRAWYRRNGGAYLAWKRGVPVAEKTPPTVWTGDDCKTSVKVANSGDAWIITSRTKLFWRLVLTRRDGFEIDNIYWWDGTQAWHPIPVHDLRACATWGSRIRFE